MTELEEVLGADLMEHSLSYEEYDYDHVISQFRIRGVEIKHVPKTQHRGGWDRDIFERYLLAKIDDGPQTRTNSNFRAYVNNYVLNVPLRTRLQRCVIL